MSEYCSICKENVDELWEGFDDCSKCTSQKKHNDRIKDLEWCEVGEHFVNKNEMWEDQNSFNFNLEYDPINFKKYVKSTYSFDAPAITRIGDIILVDEKDVNGFWDWYCKVKPDHKHKKIKV